jgi:hypothetical protein
MCMAVDSSLGRPMFPEELTQQPTRRSGLLDALSLGVARDRAGSGLRETLAKIVLSDSAFRKLECRLLRHLFLSVREVCRAMFPGTFPVFRPETGWFLA